MFESELIKYQPIHTIVKEYQEAVKEVKQAFELLQSAKKRLTLHLGEYYDSILPHRFSDNDISRIDNILLYMRKNAWRSLVEKCQIHNIISDKRSKEMDKELEDGKLPEITIENVQDIMSGFAGNINQLLIETVTETFEFLRPRRSEYKTNTEYEIGKKVILNGVIDHNKWGYTRLSYYYEQNLKSLDNVFHLLDGKGPIKYPGDLVTQIQTAIQNKKWGCETEYFKCKWYHKGTLHIEFKRMDLINQLNKTAGGNRLKGEK